MATTLLRSHLWWGLPHRLSSLSTPVPHTLQSVIGQCKCGKTLSNITASFSKQYSSFTKQISSAAKQFPTQTKQCIGYSSNHMYSVVPPVFRKFYRATPIVRQFYTWGRNVSIKHGKPMLKLRQLNQISLRFKGTNGDKPNGKSIKLPKRSDIKRLLGLAKPEKYRLTGAVLLLLISSGVTMAIPFGIGRVIDIIYTHAQDADLVSRLGSFCKILLCIFVVGAMANFGRVYLMQTSGNRIVRKLREKLFASITQQEIAFFDKTRTGELINRLSADTSLVGQSLTNNISDGLRSTAQAVAGISMMAYMSPKLCAIALSIVPPLMLLLRYYGRYVQKITRNVQDSLADSTQVAEERLSNMRTVRAFTREKQEQAVYNARIEHVLQLSYKEALARGVFWASTGLSGNIMILSIFYYGGLMMNEAQISVGELSSFMLYAAFVGVSIGGLTSFYTELMRGIGASTRLWELIDKTPVIPISGGLTPKGPVDGLIQFQNIQFSYPERPDITIFKDLNLVLPQGSVTAVVGPSGSGKSTIAALLLRYYDSRQGHITLDGHDTRDLNPTWLRSNIGIVNQEPALFSCSIADNIKYGARDPYSVTSEEITEAAKKANAYNFVMNFTSGFDTLVGERGIMLSGGQKQRIAIARAILKNPKILVLDEATSALDAESEHLVQEALERVMENRTVVTIAHRLSTIKNADNIAVLGDGGVVEYGSYNHLMALQGGLFRKLVERQTITS